MSTKTSLEELWAADIASINNVIRSQGLAVSPNPQANRVTATILYYNAGRLVTRDRPYVADPKFGAVMTAATSLHSGLAILQRDQPTFAVLVEQDPLRRKLMVLSTTIHTVAEAARSAVLVRGGPWDETPTENLAGAGGASAANDAQHMVAEFEDTPEYNDPAVMLEVKRAADVAIASMPGADTATITLLAVNAAWRAALAMDAATQAYVEAKSMYRKNFVIADVLRTLFKASVEAAVPIARCFWYYSLWDLLQDYPDAALQTQLNTYIHEYGCQSVFTLIPVRSAVPSATLGTVVGHLDPFSRTGLAGLISEYVGSPPTRMQALARLIALPSV